MWARDFDLSSNSSKLEQNKGRAYGQVVCAGRKWEQCTKENHGGGFNEDFEPGFER
jgi:hypothetical protein